MTGTGQRTQCPDHLSGRQAISSEQFLPSANYTSETCCSRGRPTRDSPHDTRCTSTIWIYYRVVSRSVCLNFSSQRFARTRQPVMKSKTRDLARTFPSDNSLPRATCLVSKKYTTATSCSFQQVRSQHYKRVQLPSCLCYDGPGCALWFPPSIPAGCFLISLENKPNSTRNGRFFL